MILIYYMYSQSSQVSETEVRVQVKQESFSELSWEFAKSPLENLQVKSELLNSPNAEHIVLYHLIYRTWKNMMKSLTNVQSLSVDAHSLFLHSLKHICSLTMGIRQIVALIVTKNLPVLRDFVHIY